MVIIICAAVAVAVLARPRQDCWRQSDLDSFSNLFLTCVGQIPNEVGFSRFSACTGVGLVATAQKSRVAAQIQELPLRWSEPGTTT